MARRKGMEIDDKLFLTKQELRPITKEQGESQTRGSKGCYGCIFAYMGSCKSWVCTWKQIFLSVPAHDHFWNRILGWMNPWAELM